MIIMGKHMIVAWVILSSLSITVAGNDVQTNLYKLKPMKRNLTDNIFQRQLIEKKYADAARNNDKIMHAINHVDEQTVFNLQNHIDNTVSTNNAENGHMKKIDTIRGKLKPSTLKLVDVTTHTTDQIKKREQIDDNNPYLRQMSSTSCHVKDVCDDQPSVSDPCLTIIPRANWLARNTKSASYMKVPVLNVFIHHTAMDRCFNSEACTHQMKEIQNFHMDIKGWDDIGYSFLVGDDGKAYEARGWDRVGAHTRGWNNISISIAVMGNFNYERPNQLALKAIDRLISCGIHRKKVLPNYNLYGHRDAASQFDSPGHMFYELIKTWPHFKTVTS